MPEKLKFDFSKEADQKRFEKLPEEERVGIIADAREEFENEKKVFLRKSLLFLEQNDIDEIVDYTNRKTRRMKREVREDFIRRLKGDYIDILSKVITKNDLEVFASSPDVQKVAVRFLEKLKLGAVNGALEIQNGPDLPEDFVLEAAQKYLLEFLESGNVDKSLEIKDKFGLPENIVLLPELQKAARTQFLASINDADRARKIKDGFNIPEDFAHSPEVQAARRNGLLGRIKAGVFVSDLEIKENFDLSNDFVKGIIQREFQSCIESGSSVFAFGLKERFSFLPKIGKETAFDLIRNRKGIVIVKDRELFEDLSMADITSQFPEIQDFTNAIRQQSPKFADKVEKALSVTIAVIYFETDDEERKNFVSELGRSQFISQAIEENPNYGIKLALKLPELDTLSRENIALLYEISAKRGDVSANSPEFRKLIQKELEGYRSNPDILAAMKERGVNIDEWLNYDEESYFDLGKEEDISLSEKLKTPVFRIRESLESYSNSLKNILAGHKKEFSGIMVSEDLEEVKLQIEKLTQEKERALAENNTKKAEGIDKGMAQLQKRIANPKNIPIWEKVLGDLSLVDRVTKDVLSAYTSLIETETSLQNYSKAQGKSARERREGVIKLKRKAENAKQEFVGKFKTLESRISIFKERLSKTLTGAIGEERANKIITDWESAIAEGMNHFESDKATVTNIFDHEDEEQHGKLDRTLMAIKVWTRNPDVDL